MWGPKNKFVTDYPVEYAHWVCPCMLLDNHMHEIMNTDIDKFFQTLALPNDARPSAATVWTLKLHIFSTNFLWLSAITNHLYSLYDIIQNGWWDLDNCDKDSLCAAMAHSLLNLSIPVLVPLCQWDQMLRHHWPHTETSLTDSSTPLNSFSTSFYRKSLH